MSITVLVLSIVWRFGFRMNIESKRSVCIACLFVITAITGIIFIKLHDEVFLFITSLSFVVLVFLFVFWHQPAVFDKYREDVRGTTYNLAKSVNDAMVKKVGLFAEELENTQNKILTTIDDAMRNIIESVKCNEKNKEDICRTLANTEICNSEIYKIRGIGEIAHDLDMLCNYIFFIGQKSFVTLEQMNSAECNVIRLRCALNDNHNGLITSVAIEALSNDISDIKELLSLQKRINDEYIDKNDSLAKLKTAIAQHALEGQHWPSSLVDICSELLFLSRTITSIAANLMEISRMVENDLLILLNMYERSLLFQAKSQAFNADTEMIKSRLQQVLISMRHDDKDSDFDEWATMRELESIKTLVNELKFDCPN